MALLALFLFTGLVSSQRVDKQFTIAAVFDQDGDSRHEVAFRNAVQGINRNPQLLPGVALQADVVTIAPDDTFAAEKRTCHLLEKGIVAIFGPHSMSSSEHIRMIADAMEVPYIETRWNYRPQSLPGQGGNDYAVNLHPDITTLSTAYLDLMQAYKWTTITILYQDNDSMMTLQEIFRKTTATEPMGRLQIVVKRLEQNQNGYRDVLNEIFQSKSKLIVLDCEKKILEEVLRQCQQVGLVSKGYSFFLTSLDSHAVNLDDFKYGGTNFTAFRMVDAEKPEVSNVILSIVKSMINDNTGVSGLPDGNLDTTSALIYDSVTAFALALHELDGVQRVRQQALDCYGDNAWVHGNSLINYMKMVEFIGLSGKIEFDTSGRRTQMALDLMELQATGLVKVGSWNTGDHLTLAREHKDVSGDITLDLMTNKTFTITTILTPPYTMLVESTKKMSGNAKFEGFAIELADHLAKELKCNFDIKLVNPDKPGSKYGQQMSPGVWSGMLGEVNDGIADFVIADMSITSERAASFTFSIPWMNLGIAILYIPPRSAAPSLLAFLDPFTTDVYIYAGLLFVLVTLVIFVLARFSPNQWEEPPNCIKDPEEYENQFTFLNSFWFTLGALMQQGSDVEPLALCVRFAGGIWFFFALIMIASYTANLAAFLTVETLVSPINRVEDLVNQQEIWYGMGKGGSTSKFFANSNNDVFQRLNAFMTGIHTDEVLMDSNDAGVEKVEQSGGKYAFFMESSSIDYIVERNCALAKVGYPLDSKGYGIGIKQGAPYKPLIDAAILRLKENGVLHRLQIKWWKQKRGGGACAGKKGGGGVKPLGLGSVMGVFLVTMVGCTIAAVFAVLEFLYGTKLSGGDAGVKWTDEMISDLKFIFLCHGNTMNTKRVREGAKSEASVSYGTSELHKEDLDGGENTPYVPYVSQEPPYAAAASLKSLGSRRLEWKSPVSSGESDSHSRQSTSCEHELVGKREEW